MQIAALTPSMKKFLLLTIWWTSVKGPILWRETATNWHEMLYCLCWQCTMVGKIAEPMPKLRPWMYPLHLVKILWTLVQ